MYKKLPDNGLRAKEIKKRLQSLENQFDGKVLGYYSIESSIKPILVTLLLKSKSIITLYYDEIEKSSKIPIGKAFSNVK